MRDEELTKRLQAAHPGRLKRDGDLDKNAESTLRTILRNHEHATVAVLEDARTAARKPSRQPSRWSRPIYLSAAATFIVIMVATLTMVMTPRGTAWAATPPQLAAETIPGTPKELLMGLSESVRQDDSPGGQTVYSQSWALMFTPESESLPVAIVPEVREFTRRTDGSFLIEVRAGTPYGTNGDIVTLTDVTPGSLIWRDDIPAGEYQPIYPETPPSVDDDYAIYFQLHNPIGSDPTTGDYFVSARLLMDEWSMNGIQEAALLEFLASLPDISVDGSVTDRLGRDGVSFSTTSRAPGQYRDTLVVAAGKGILSHETTYIGSDRTDIQAPAIIEYTAWQGKEPHP